MAGLPPQGVGRIVFTHGALPAVATVNYRVLGARILFRTGVDTVLARSVRDAVVAFAVDVDGPTTGSGPGWTITVTGRCRALPDPPEEVRRGLTPWAPGVRDSFHAVDVALVHRARLDG